MAAVRKCGLCRAPGHIRSACPASAFREDGRYDPDDVTFSAAMEALPRVPKEAWTKAREAYKAGDRDGPHTKIIHAVMEELAALKDRLTAAATVADFMLCAITAGKTPNSDFGAIDWAHEYVDFDMAEVSDYATQAVKWLLWMEKNPEMAPRAGEEWPAGNGKGVRKVGPASGVYGTDNLEDARQKAIATLDDCIGKLL